MILDLTPDADGRGFHQHRLAAFVDRLRVGAGVKQDPHRSQKIALGREHEDGISFGVSGLWVRPFLQQQLHDSGTGLFCRIE